MSTLLTVVIGLLSLSVLVVFHELGHYLVARAFGIRVERFSVGFGKAIIEWRRGDTEWRIASVPLGGYVRMAGENPEEDSGPKRPDEFRSKVWWQRFLVVVAGPIANLAFALIANSLIGVVGYEIPLYSTTVERVEAQAVEVGFQPGDRIVSVDGEPVESWYAFQLALRDASESVGDDAAAMLAVTVERADGTHALELPAAGAEQLMTELQPWSAPRIGQVTIAGPAYQSGLKPGDVVAAIDGEPVDSWAGMRELIITRPDEDLQLTVLRGERELTVDVHTLAQEDPSGGEPIGVIGITMDTPTQRYPLPLRASLVDGWQRTRFLVGFAYSSLGQMVTNPSMARDNLAGPITIVQMAGSSRRPSEALNFMAVISVFLMVINLLPIPILDGGHALFCVIEGLRGAPLTIRAQLNMQKVGLVIIGSLLIVALWNDARRMGERIFSVQRLGRQTTTEQQP